MRWARCAQTCLRLTKSQRSDISALYERHLQALAATRQGCLNVASKLQVGQAHASVCLIDVTIEVARNYIRKWSRSLAGCL